MTDQERIAELLQPYLNGDQFYIVDIQVAGRQGGRLKVSVLLDSDTGITIDECANVSRRLGAQLDELDIFGNAPFTLEVSSPGVDQPLRFRRQYVKNVGRQLRLTLASGQTVQGKLLAVGDNHIVLDVVAPKVSKKKAAAPAEPPLAGEQTFLLDSIEKANVEISFN